MGFCPMSSHICRHKERFNSQRDGILHKEAKKHISSNNVSISNGMEFYVKTREGYHYNLCFNSQLDGILHNATGYVMKYITFQFLVE